MKIAHIGPKPWLVGKKLSEEHKKKISLSNIGKHIGIVSPMKGRYHSEEAKRKIREKREKQIKGGSRVKKLELIRKMNPNFEDLYVRLF